MTQFASAVRGFEGGMRLGMMADEQKERKQYLADQNRRANEQHGADMQYHQVRMDTQMLNNEIAKRSAEMAKTEDGIKQMKMLAGGYGALMDAAANGKPVPKEAEQAFYQGLDAVLGPMVNSTGPAHLDQKISRVEMGPDGARVMLHNTNKDTGESYEAPMTLGRQAGEKNVAVIPPNALMDGMRTMFSSAVQAGVDPRVLIHAMEGGEQWVDSVNSQGIAGQRNTVTGKFDEGREPRETTAEKIASALAVKNAELDWQERNAGRISGMELNRERNKIEAQKRIDAEYPEIAAGKQAKENVDNFNDVVKNIYSKVGTKDESGMVYTGDMAKRAVTEAAIQLGVYEQVKDRLPAIQLSPDEQQQVDDAAEADVDSVYGMGILGSKEDLMQFGGASSKDEAIRNQKEKRRQEALDQKRMGMGLQPTQRPAASAPTSQREAAMQWLQQNPNDPRAAEIKKRLGLS